MNEFQIRERAHLSNDEVVAQLAEIGPRAVKGRWRTPPPARYIPMPFGPPIGWVPRYEDIQWKGMKFSQEDFDALEMVDRERWREEVIGHERLFIDLHAHLPPEMIYERELSICRL